MSFALHVIIDLFVIVVVFYFNKLGCLEDSSLQYEYEPATMNEECFRFVRARLLARVAKRAPGS